MSENGEIQGLVAGADGRPLEGATALIVDGPPHPDVAAVTDAQGEFRLTDLKPGAYVISLSAEGSEPVKNLVEVGGGRLSYIRVVLQNNVEGEIESEIGPRATIRRGGRMSDRPGRVQSQGPTGRKSPRPAARATSKNREGSGDEGGGDIALQPPAPEVSSPYDLPSGTFQVKLGEAEFAVTLLRRHDLLSLEVKAQKLAKHVPSKDKTDMESRNMLQRKTWVLRSYEGNAVLEGSVITAIFGESRLSGNGGCNEYEGTYTVDVDAIVVGDLRVTEMYCDKPSGVMEQEHACLALLQRASSFNVKEAMLIIFDTGGVPILQFDCLPTD